MARQGAKPVRTTNVLSHGDIEQTIESCEQSLRFRRWHSEQIPYVLCDIGDEYALLGNYAIAMKFYDRARQLRPNLAWPFFGIAEVYMHVHQYPQAIDYYGEVIRLQPDDDIALNNRCWARTVWGRQLDVALGDCDASIRLKPDNAATLDSRCFLYFRLGDFRNAIRDCDAALAVDPKLAPSLYVRGLAKLKMHDDVGGNSDIATAKVFDSKIADTYKSYGVVP